MSLGPEVFKLERDYFARTELILKESISKVSISIVFPKIGPLEKTFLKQFSFSFLPFTVGLLSC